MEDEHVSTVALLQKQFPKGKKKKTRHSFRNSHHLTAECLLVLRQSRWRFEVKSSDLAKRERWFWQCSALFTAEGEGSGSTGGASALPLVFDMCFCFRHASKYLPRREHMARLYARLLSERAVFMMRLHPNSQDALSLRLSGAISSASVFRGRAALWHIVFFTVMACRSWSSTADGSPFTKIALLVSFIQEKSLAICL